VAEWALGAPNKFAQSLLIEKFAVDDFVAADASKSNKETQGSTTVW
jgi:hypothetical protein